MPYRAQDYIEIDVDYCSLTYGVLPCYAKLGGHLLGAYDFKNSASRNIESNGIPTGMTTDRQFTLSMWVKLRALTTHQYFLHSVATADTATTHRFEVFYWSASAGGDGRIYARYVSAAGTTIWHVRSHVIAASEVDKWHHVLISVNLETGVNTFYWDDVDVGNNFVHTNADILFASLVDWSIGATATGASPVNGLMAELWFKRDVALDMSIESNRRKFISKDAEGNLFAADLGLTGELPFGSTPQIYFSWEKDNDDTSNANKGRGTTWVGSTADATPDGDFITGLDRCFNTFGTCQAVLAFENDPKTMRFCLPSIGRKLDVHAYPLIDEIKFKSSTIALGEDSMGVRGSISVRMRDIPSPDTGEALDPYYKLRSYNPYKQGTFWGKFKARQKYLRSRKLRYVRGYTDQTRDEMEVRNFLIETVEGPDNTGKYTITAKDPLKFFDDDRAQCPIPSNGFLLAGITNVATAATLSPSGIGNAEYPTSGYCNVGGREIMAFTRSGDNLTFTARAQFNTTAVAHNGQDRVQVCEYVNAQTAANIIYRLATSFSECPADYIPLAQWQTEVNSFLNVLYTRCIPDPVGTGKLISSLCQQAGLSIWWDDISEEIKLQVLRPISTSAAVFDRKYTESGSFRVKEQPAKRISEVLTYFGMINPLEGIDDPNNYRSSVLDTDLQSAGELGHKTPAFKKIFASWIPPFARPVATKLNELQLGRYIDAPRKFNFSLPRTEFLPLQPFLGSGYQLEAYPLQKANGEPDRIPIQIIRLDLTDEGYDVEAEEFAFKIIDTSGLGDLGKALIIDSNIYNFNWKTAFDAVYPPAIAGEKVTCIIQDGVIVGSTSSSLYSFEVGTGWAAGVDLNLIVLGRIQGIGGKGADGSTGARNGAPGGPALRTLVPIKVNNQVGQIWSGGGGGGDGDSIDGRASGGGGGAGYPPGGGGINRNGTKNSGDGTTEVGGAGGQQYQTIIGGYGGNPGQPGTQGPFSTSPYDAGLGGAAGTAITGNSLITFLGSQGDIRGPRIG